VKAREPCSAAARGRLDVLLCAEVDEIGERPRQGRRSRRAGMRSPAAPQRAPTPTASRRRDRSRRAGEPVASPSRGFRSRRGSAALVREVVERKAEARQVGIAARRAAASRAGRPAPPSAPTRSGALRSAVPRTSRRARTRFSSFISRGLSIRTTSSPSVAVSVASSSHPLGLPAHEGRDSPRRRTSRARASAGRRPPKLRAQRRVGLRQASCRLDRAQVERLLVPREGTSPVGSPRGTRRRR
jgi:hypothetical protein